jgi:hypothetical protein
VETAVDGKTWKYKDNCLAQASSKEEAKSEEAAALEDGMLPQPSYSVLPRIGGPPHPR